MKTTCFKDETYRYFLVQRNHRITVRLQYTTWSIKSASKPVKRLYLSNLEKNFFRIAGALKLHFFGFGVLTKKSRCCHNAVALLPRLMASKSASTTLHYGKGFRVSRHLRLRRCRSCADAELVLRFETPSV